jgi:hypothetical protein
MCQVLGNMASAGLLLHVSLDADELALLQQAVTARGGL